jgi:hypothetical protein
MYEVWRQTWPTPTNENGNPVELLWDDLPEEGKAIFREMARVASSELGVPIDD